MFLVDVVQLGHIFLIHSDNLYLLIGAFRPLIFKEFIDVAGLISTTDTTVSYILPCSLFCVLSSSLSAIHAFS